MLRESVRAGPITKGVGEPFLVSDRRVSNRRGALDALRAQIRAIECDGESAVRVDAMPFGIEAIDQALPWGGLPRAALHAIAVDAPESPAKADTKAHARARTKAKTVAEAVVEATGAATGFAAALLGRLCGNGHALWCLRRGDLYAPGLAAFGIDPARLLVVRVERPEDALWVLEEALACGRFAAVLGETAADLTASRRLQLAARDHGTTCLLLDRGDNAGGAAAALTRWHVDAVPGAASLGGGPAAAGWRVTLTRCRGGATPRDWTIGWCHETCDFTVAAALADRPAMPARPVAWPPASQPARRAG